MANWHCFVIFATVVATVIFIPKTSAFPDFPWGDLLKYIGSLQNADSSSVEEIPLMNDDESSQSDVTPTVEEIPLTYDGSTNEYYLTAKFGTPEQTFSLVSDTMTLYTAFRSPSEPASDPERRFNRLSSTTYKNKTGGLVLSNLIYISVGRSDVVEDVLTLGSIQMRHNAYIASAMTRISPNAKYDGVLGLSPRRYDVESPLLWKLHENGLIERPMFTTYMKSKPTDGGNGGYLTLGGIDTKHCSGDVHYQEPGPKLDENWIAQLQSFQINKQTIDCGEICNGLLSSTYQHIYGPVKLIEEINKMLGAVGTDYHSVPTVDCSTISSLPNVQLLFNGYEISLSYKDYITERTGSDGTQICETVFNRELEGPGNVLIFGIPVYKKVCIVHEYEGDAYKVGFMNHETD